MTEPLDTVDSGGLSNTTSTKSAHRTTDATHVDVLSQNVAWLEPDDAWSATLSPTVNDASVDDFDQDFQVLNESLPSSTNDWLFPQEVDLQIHHMKQLVQRLHRILRTTQQQSELEKITVSVRTAADSAVNILTSNVVALGVSLLGKHSSLKKINQRLEALSECVEMANRLHRLLQRQEDQRKHRLDEVSAEIDECLRQGVQRSSIAKMMCVELRVLEHWLATRDDHGGGANCSISGDSGFLIPPLIAEPSAVGDSLPLQWSIEVDDAIEEVASPTCESKFTDFDSDWSECEKVTDNLN